MSESATVSFPRPVTAAAGVYAPGHIGELTQYLPFELVDDVLFQTKTVQRRLRDLPSRVGVYFVLALVLFPHVGYERVWQKLTAGLSGLEVPHPSEKALRELRRRLGPGPFKALFEVVAGPLGQPSTPGVCYRGLPPSPSTAATPFGCPTPSATGPGWVGSATGWASPATPPCG